MDAPALEELRVLREAFAALAGGGSPNSEPARGEEAWVAAGGNLSDMYTLLASEKERAARRAREAKERSEGASGVTAGPTFEYFMDLPDDLVVQIAFDHLADVKDLISLGQSCRKLRHLLLGPAVFLDPKRSSPAAPSFYLYDANAENHPKPGTSVYTAAGLAAAAGKEEAHDDSDEESAGAVNEVSVVSLASDGLLSAMGTAGISPESSPSLELHWEQRFFRDFPYLRASVPPGDPEKLWRCSKVDDEAVAYARHNPPDSLAGKEKIQGSFFGPQHARAEAFRARRVPNPDNVSVGAKIYGQWLRVNGSVYTGVVTAVNKKKGKKQTTVSIRYDDGDTESSVPIGRIRLMDDPEGGSSDDESSDDANNADVTSAPDHGGVAPFRFRWPFAFKFRLEKVFSRNEQERLRALRRAHTLDAFARHLCLELLRQRLAELETERTGGVVWRTRYECFARGLTRYRVAAREGGKNSPFKDALVRVGRSALKPRSNKSAMPGTDVVTVLCPQCDCSVALEDIKHAGGTPRGRSKSRGLSRFTDSSDDEFSSSSSSDDEGPNSPEFRDVQVGDMVRSKWSRGGEYRGTVALFRDDGKVEIDYDDGDHDTDQKLSDIRPDPEGAGIPANMRTPREILRDLKDAQRDAKIYREAMEANRIGKPPEIWTIQWWPDGALHSKRVRDRVSNAKVKHRKHLRALDDADIFNVS